MITRITYFNYIMLKLDGVSLKINDLKSYRKTRNNATGCMNLVSDSDHIKLSAFYNKNIFSEMELFAILRLFVEHRPWQRMTLQPCLYFSGFVMSCRYVMLYALDYNLFQILLIQNLFIAMSVPYYFSFYWENRIESDNP